MLSAARRSNPIGDALAVVLGLVRRIEILIAPYRPIDDRFGYVDVVAIVSRSNSHELEEKDHGMGAGWDCGVS